MDGEARPPSCRWGHRWWLLPPGFCEEPANGFHPSGAGAGTEHPTASSPHAAGMLLLPALQQLELESVKGGR